MAQAVGKRGCDHGGETVGAVPCGHANGLFSSSEPLRGDDGEEWEAACFEET